MQAWNAVVSVKEHGFKKALDVLSAFGEVHRTEFFNVLLLRAENLNSMLEALRNQLLDHSESLGFLARLIPITQSFTFQYAEEFKVRAQKAVGEYVCKLRRKSFHVRLHRRGFKGRITSPEVERFLNEALLDDLEKAGTAGRLTFDNPDAVIGVETVGTWAGFTLLTREDFKRYPFVRID